MSKKIKALYNFSTFFPYKAKSKCALKIDISLAERT